MNLKKYSFVMWIFFVVCIGLFSCGGGGGGESTPGNNTVIDTQTAEEATGIALMSRVVMDSALDIAIEPQSIDTPSNKIDTFMNVAVNTTLNKAISKINEIISSSKSEKSIAGYNSVSAFCSGGGWMSYTMLWEGPDISYTCYDINNLYYRIDADNCWESGMKMDGTIIIAFTGNMCAPSSITIEYSGVSMDIPQINFYFTSKSFNLSFTEMQWSSYGFAHLKTTMTGDISATYLGETYMAQYNNFSIDLTTYDGIEYIFYIDGSITGGCFGGWITFQTISPIHQTIYDTCPHSGILKIIGNGEVIIQFNNDGSVNIGTWYYPSCASINGSVCLSY